MFTPALSPKNYIYTYSCNPDSVYVENVIVTPLTKWSYVHY